MLSIMKHISLFSIALFFGNTAAIAQQFNFNTDKIGSLLQHARTDMTIVCAHRGLHGSVIGRNSQNWVRDIPENSIPAVQQATQQGIECSEIDLRTDRRGNVVLMHDSNLGRTTNVAAARSAQQYDPYRETGYNPSVDSYDGATPNLMLLRPDLSSVTNYGLARFEALLDTIKDQKLSTILMLDMRDIGTAKKAWDIVKSRTNGWGTPAERWVYFKLPVTLLGNTASDFERSNIFPSSDLSRIRIIPVFGANFIDASRGNDAAKSNWHNYYIRPYVYATELVLKQYDSAGSHPLNNIVKQYIETRRYGNVKVLGSYQPVPETKYNSYFALDGHCCTEPAFWLWRSQYGYGQEYYDNRPDLTWQMTVADSAFSYIITDDPLTAISRLQLAGRRNLSVIR